MKPNGNVSSNDLLTRYLFISNNNAFQNDRTILKKTALYGHGISTEFIQKLTQNSMNSAQTWKLERNLQKQNRTITCRKCNLLIWAKPDIVRLATHNLRVALHRANCYIVTSKVLDIDKYMVCIYIYIYIYWRYIMIGCNIVSTCVHLKVSTARTNSGNRLIHWSSCLVAKLHSPFY